MKATLIQFFLLIKNATLLKHTAISVAYKKPYTQALEFLYKEGLIQHFLIQNNTKKITVYLKPSASTIFRNLKILSKQSTTNYLTHIRLCQIFEKNNIFLISTPYGFKTLQSCKKKNLGGKVLIKF